LRWRDGTDDGRIGPECQMTATKVSIQGKVLSSISGLASDIEFIYVADRDDLLGTGKRLESLEIKSGNFNKMYTFHNYDNEGKVLIKKIPSKDIIHYRYYSRDLQIGFQDGYLRDQTRPWFGYKYDAYGRELDSGFYTNEPTSGGVTPNTILTKTTYGTSAAQNLRNKGKVTNYQTRLLGTNRFFENDSI